MRNGVLNNEGENAQRIENALSSDPFSSYWKSKVLVCGLFAVGLGNNKQKYTRAASLALAIAALLESPGGEFLAHFCCSLVEIGPGNDNDNRHNGNYFVRDRLEYSCIWRVIGHLVQKAGRRTL